MKTPGVSLLCLLTAAATAVLSLVRLDGAKDSAAAADLELAACRRVLADPARRAALGDSGAGLADDAASPGGGAGPHREGPLRELMTRLGRAGAAAGLSDRLPGIDPAEPSRVAGTGYDETKVFLRFESVTLEELTRFLHHLSAADPNAGAQMIELSPPSVKAAAVGTAPAVGATAAGGERWAADVTLAYLSRAAAAGGR